MKRSSWLLAIVVTLLLPCEIRAQQSTDRTQYFKDIVIEAGETGDDAFCYFCSIRVQGTLAGDALAIGGSIEVLGTLEGDAVVSGGSIRLGPGARIGGDAVAVGGDIERDSQSTVGGELSATRWFHLPGQRQVFLRGVLAILGSNLLLVVLCYLLLRRRRLEVMADSLRHRPGLVLLTGMGVLAMGVLLIVISAYVERITAVVATLVPLILLVIAGLGYPGIAYGLGRRVASGKWPFLAALFAAILITLLQFIPAVGFGAFGMLGVLALGSAVASGIGRSTDWLSRRVTKPKTTSPSSLAP